MSMNMLENEFLTCSIKLFKYYKKLAWRKGWSRKHFTDGLK